MEQEGPRNKFLKEFDKFIDGIDVNEDFLEKLSTHSMAHLLPFIKKLTEDGNGRKIMIFLEFTRDRVPCNELAQILDQCGYTDKATLLRLYNTSEKPMTYKYEYLEVIKANVLRSAPVLTNSYEMIARPRGIALIVLNDPVLASEAKVFANIFKQLDFVVPDIEQTTGLTRRELDAILNDTRTKVSDEHDAFIFMYIGHGCNEGIVDVDGELFLTKNIIDKFNKKVCPDLGQKPKIFIFNCCRSVDPELSKRYKMANKDDELANVDKAWKNSNQRTIVFYSCAQGNDQYHYGGHSYFGRALSHNIAQYSWYKDLEEIFHKTISRMEDDFIETFGDDSLHLNPEIRKFTFSKRLYFNPGYLHNVN